MPRERILKVNELLKEEVGNILLRQQEFPTGAVVTITRADASPNLQQANIYISVLPKEFEEQVLKGLEARIYSIQQELNEKLRMRPVPRIQWRLDEQGEHAQRVDELLRKIKKEEEK